MKFFTASLIAISSLLFAEDRSTVIFLNGTSSSGKTSIARQLQKLSEEPFFYAGIDLFISMMPPSYMPKGEKEDLGFKVVQKPGPLALVEVGPLAQSLVNSMHRCMKVMLDHRLNLILDEVLVSAEDFEDYLELFKDYRVLFVGINPPLEVAEQRERERGDRLLGFARGFLSAVHRGKKYDLIIDSSQNSPEQSARIILDYLLTHPTCDAFASNHPRTENAGCH